MQTPATPPASSMRASLQTFIDKGHTWEELSPGAQLRVQEGIFNGYTVKTNLFTSLTGRSSDTSWKSNHKEKYLLEHLAFFAAEKVLHRFEKRLGLAPTPSTHVVEGSTAPAPEPVVAEGSTAPEVPKESLEDKARRILQLSAPELTKRSAQVFVANDKARTQAIEAFRSMEKDTWREVVDAIFQEKVTAQHRVAYQARMVDELAREFPEQAYARYESEKQIVPAESNDKRVHITELQYKEGEVKEAIKAVLEAEYGDKMTKLYKLTPEERTAVLNKAYDTINASAKNKEARMLGMVQLFSDQLNVLASQAQSSSAMAKVPGVFTPETVNGAVRKLLSEHSLTDQVEGNQALDLQQFLGLATILYRSLLIDAEFHSERLAMFLRDFKADKLVGIKASDEQNTACVIKMGANQLTPTAFQVTVAVRGGQVELSARFPRYKAAELKSPTIVTHAFNHEHITVTPVIEPSASAEQGYNLVKSKSQPRLLEVNHDVLTGLVQEFVGACRAFDRQHHAHFVKPQ